MGLTGYHFYGVSSHLSGGIPIIVVQKTTDLSCNYLELHALGCTSLNIGEKCARWQGLFQRQHILVKLPQMFVGHVKNWLIHERIQMDVLRRHEDDALDPALAHLGCVRRLFADAV